MYQLYRNKSEYQLPQIESNSVDCFFLDPPYNYLKKTWDSEFDEDLVFSQITRISKKDCYLILFGRGISFARMQLKLHDLGWQFKEEVVWNKTQCSSPLMAMSRVHETCIIFARGNAKVRKVKVPYLKMKAHDINAIITDIKRLCTTFNNPNSLKAVQMFLENNSKFDYICKKNDTTVSGDIGIRDI